MFQLAKTIKIKSLAESKAVEPSFESEAKEAF
jgi:hypothetical protein